MMGRLSTVHIALGLSLSFCAMAQQQRLPSDEYEVYRADKERIEREYKADKERCDSLEDNAEDICLAEAEGKQDVAKAELEARYKPSRETHYQVQVARAKANYRVAKERCDDHSGNLKDVCVKEAKAAEAAAVADAKREDYETRNPAPAWEGGF